MEIVVVVVPLILHNKEDRNFGQRINTRGWLLLYIRAVQTDTSFLKITHVWRRRKQEDAPLRLVIYQGVATIISTTRKLFAIIIIPSQPDSRYIVLHLPASLLDADIVSHRRTFDIIRRSSAFQLFPVLLYVFIILFSLSLSSSLPLSLSATRSATRCFVEIKLQPVFSLRSINSDLSVGMICYGGS